MIDSEAYEHEPDQPRDDIDAIAVIRGVAMAVLLTAAGGLVGWLGWYSIASWWLA